jgi:hypothetical protein
MRPFSMGGVRALAGRTGGAHKENNSRLIMITPIQMRPPRSAAAGDTTQSCRRARALAHTADIQVCTSAPNATPQDKQQHTVTPQQ